MPGYGARFWAERTADNRRRRYPKFRGKHNADAVVIGGGLTGCTIASVLAQAGLKVMLLEANRLAEGATAGSPGVIVPEPDAAFRAADELAGRRASRIVWEEAKKGAVDFAARLKKLSTKCDLTPAPFLMNTRRSEDAQALRKEQTARRDAGIVAPWLAGPAVQAEIGTESLGAFRFSDAFTFDPVRAALGLAGAAETSGAEIFEQSEARRTRFTRRYAEVVLASGVIRTRLIVMATGEPGPIIGQLRRHVRRLDGYAVVTEPLSAAMRRETGKHRAVVTEFGAEPHWWRWLPDDRMLFAGAASKPVGTRLREKALVQRTAQLMYELSVRHPVISGLRAQWGWDLPIVTAADTLPWIGPHRNYPFHFLALAFGWNADGLIWTAAKAALRFAKGEPKREDNALGFARHL
jgi:glycine/D-amino acid oxidase-like deaminating enzyme